MDSLRIVKGNAQRRAAMPVALVSMPFVLHCRPSLQLGLLKSIAAAHGFPATTFHLHLDFAQRMGLPLDEALCLSRSRECLLGDWLFSVAAFGDDTPDPDDRLLDDFGADVDSLLTSLNLTRDQLRAIRHEEVPKYLDAMLDTIAWEQFREVKSNLTREQIKTLHEGGVRRIQPGIESFNSHVLKLMRKGVTAIHAPRSAIRLRLSAACQRRQHRLLL